MPTRRRGCCDGSLGTEDVAMDVWDIRKDRIRNEDNQDKVGVVPVENKM